MYKKVSHGVDFYLYRQLAWAHHIFPQQSWVGLTVALPLDLLHNTFQYIEGQSSGRRCPGQFQLDNLWFLCLNCDVSSAVGFTFKLRETTKNNGNTTYRFEKFGFLWPTTLREASRVWHWGFLKQFMALVGGIITASGTVSFRLFI